jgi:hypothetical protein
LSAVFFNSLLGSEMGNFAAFDNLDRLRTMAKSKAGTSGFSKLDLLALQMAVGICELLIDADRRHNGDLEMHDVDDQEKPKMLCVGGREEHYGGTCFDCFVKGAEALRQLKSTSA